MQFWTSTGLILVLSAMGLTYEIAAGRVLALFFGTSLVMWTAVIAAGRQRWRHAGLIRAHHGCRDFEAATDARFRPVRWLCALCWTGDDRPGLLLDRAMPWLLGARSCCRARPRSSACARIRRRV